MAAAYNLTVAFSSESSIESEVNRESAWDVSTVVVYFTSHDLVAFSQAIDTKQVVMNL
jgi:C1A family cysteine protease